MESVDILPTEKIAFIAYNIRDETFAFMIWIAVGLLLLVLPNQYCCYQAFNSNCFAYREL